MVDQTGPDSLAPPTLRRVLTLWPLIFYGLGIIVGAGIYVAIGAGDEVLMKRDLVGRGLYPSIDDDWWICIRGGEIRCVFKPTGGM